MIPAGRRRLAVPLSAVLSQQGSQGVLVADRGRVRFQKVTLGLNDGKQSAVLKGLKEGQLVVINPAGIMPGQKIHPEVRQTAQRD